MQAGRVIAEGSPHALMSGAHGDYVDELMATPRRQAEQLAALIDRGARA
jgi:osmoprotectant transport system ATP-binding protein